MGEIIDEGLRPDADEIYKRGWTILTGRNLNDDSASRYKRSSEREKLKQSSKRRRIK